MRLTIHRIGNSQGVLLPKPLLAQVGLGREVELTVEHDALVLRKPSRRAREGWADASKAIADRGDDALIWPEFTNDDDPTLTW